MRRIKISGNCSNTEEKIRIFDVIIHNDGSQEIEVKDGKMIKTVLLLDVQEQIKTAQNE